MKRITLRIWSLCACFAACEESGTFPDTGNEPNAVRFSVTTSDTQNPVTRAYDTWWEKNDEIGIYMYRTATPDFTTLNTKEHNAEYAVTTNTDAKTTGLQPVSKHLIFPADGSKV
ncbi:MAG: fimbrillin family protein, partial [Prevotellaceae bacterium]|nr:fimbrillin family protein [Prevotellaceae bacterium]